MPDSQIANFLLDIKAVKLSVKEPFTWTSGIKSPIYCDCRVVNSHVAVRNAVIDKFTDLISKSFVSKTDIIGGVASGGISYGALIADRLSLPFVYVREERKKYGLGKQIEGEVKKGERVVLIEDLISTGGSSIKAAKVIRSEELELVCLLSIMTYGFKEAEYNFNEANVPHESLCDLDTILTVASEKNIINSNDIDNIMRFRQSPKNWEP